MAQFIVYENGNPASRKRVPCLLDVQSDLIDAMDSRVVVPLIRVAGSGRPIDGLMPAVVVGGEPMLMDTAHLAGVPRSVIGKKVEDLSGERATIMAALDFLVSGI